MWGGVAIRKQKLQEHTYLHPHNSIKTSRNVFSLKKQNKTEWLLRQITGRRTWVE